MKQFLSKLIIISVLLSMVVCAFVGCKEEPVNEYTPFVKGLNATSSCTQINQTVEVKSNQLLVYSQEKRFIRMDTTYNIDTTEKLLNRLGLDNAYTETSYSETATAAKNFASVLKINSEYFESPEVRAQKLTSPIRSDKVDEFFGLTGAHVEIKNAILTMNLTDERLMSLKITFTADNIYSVEVNLTYYY